MAGLSEAPPFIACGPDYAAHAGHIAMPFAPADRDDGALPPKWPNVVCHGSSGLEHADAFLPTLPPWQAAEWDMAQGFLKYPEPSFHSPPAESVTSGTDSSVGAGTPVWDYQNDQLSHGRELSPCTTATSPSEHSSFDQFGSIAPLSLHTFKKEESPSSSAAAASKKQSKPRKPSTRTSSSSPKTTPKTSSSTSPKPSTSSSSPSSPKTSSHKTSPKTSPRPSPVEEGGISKRPRRTKTAQEQEATRARIREKNRVAADKCRGRQRIAVEKLSAKHDALEEENRQLSQILKDLVAERIVLKNMLLEHGNCGSELIENYLRESAVRWVKQVESQAVNVEAA
ncbi:basic-leucine zipper transcription factor [Trichoderma aethiopicum]